MVVLKFTIEPTFAFVDLFYLGTIYRGQSFPRESETLPFRRAGALPFDSDPYVYTVDHARISSQYAFLLICSPSWSLLFTVP